MGGLAAVAGAVAAVAGLVLYLYRRHDAPAAVREREDEKRNRHYAEFDEALGEGDAEALTRMFGDLDDRMFDDGGGGLRPEDGGHPGRPGDKAAP